MKAMKRTVSKIAKGKRARSSVFRGSKEKTMGGLTKEKLQKNKLGKVVSKAASIASKKAYKGSKLEAWVKATTAARKALGFTVVGGKTSQGKALYAKAKSIYAEAA